MTNKITSTGRIVVDRPNIQKTPTANEVDTASRKEHRLKIVSKKLPVMEMFGTTIQGEGPLTGSLTWFLRLGLCDFDCAMCDSKHSVDAREVSTNARWMTQEEIAYELIEQMGHCRWLTISGGNPCIHDLTDLVKALRHEGILIAVETQGTKAPDWLRYVNSIVVSPKPPGMGNTKDGNTMAVLTEFRDEAIRLSGMMPSLKVPIFSEQDIEYALEAQELMFEGFDLHGGHNGVLYLSLGNTLYNEDYELFHSNIIARFKQMLKVVAGDPRLRDVAFTPQLHTLIWGNEKEV